MEKKKSKSFLLSIMRLLILAEIVLTLLAAPDQDVLLTLCAIIPLAFIALYGSWFYRKPHGNMLRYAMLLLAAAEIVSAAQCIELNYNKFYLNVIWLFVAAALVYVAGRLNRIEQNKYLLSAASIVQVVITFIMVFLASDSIAPLHLLSWFCDAISVITLMIAYFVRYKEHKEAGLADAPKK